MTGHDAKNKGEGSGMDGVSGQSQATKYACLTKCGKCETDFGQICNGTTVFAVKEEFWRQPVGYKSFECKPGNCVGAKQISAPDRITGVWPKQ
eukprot:gene504-21420_t